MKTRKLLSDNDGVIWNDKEETKVLFSYMNFKYKVDSGLQITDLTSGKKCKVNDGILKAKKENIYLIEKDVEK